MNDYTLWFFGIGTFAEGPPQSFPVICPNRETSINVYDDMVKAGWLPAAPKPE